MRRSGYFGSFSYLFLGLALILPFRAPLAAQDSCGVPLDETKSAPAIDLIQDGTPIDRDRLLQQIRDGFDSSTLEPQLSRVYRRDVQPNTHDANESFPDEGSVMDYQQTLPGTSGLVRARVSPVGDGIHFYQMNFSLDTHAALARNALLRRLGYAIPTPQFYSKLKLRFSSIDQRDSFLDQLSSDTLTARSRWVVESRSKPAPDLLTLTFQDLVLEPAIIEVPQFHWGILTPEALNSRRSLRALLVPLTLLELPESVNLYSFETAKIFNESMVFTRTHANAFKNETSIGDVRWIARKIARLNREDWKSILKAAHYPEDIEALLLEKTLGRVNQLMGLLEVGEFSAFSFNPKISVGKVVKGKATQERYDGYALRFTYGDPKSPLRPSELARFFGIAGLNGALNSLLDKANTYLQITSPDQWIQDHQDQELQDILTHFQNHPNEPYIQPVKIWGGPVAGVDVNASRNIITGTYYGSDSQIQLVDAISGSAHIGGFFGISGIPKMGFTLEPNLQGSRSYVHVKPLPDLKAAWKDSWAHVFVPAFMPTLAQALKDSTNPDSKEAMKKFMDQMTPGEIFMITDSVVASGSVNAYVPLGALMGFLPSYGSLTGSASLGGSYAILSRTTIARSKDGIQVYLQDAKSQTLEIDINAEFIIRVVDLNGTTYRGTADTQAFVLPEKFDDEAKSKAFVRDFRSLFRANHSENLAEDFEPYLLDHDVRGHRIGFGLGPFSWVLRDTLHKVEITPPKDPEGRYQAQDFKRTVIEGTRTRIHGTDYYGFFGRLLRGVHPLLNIGGPARGDDPSANFLGRSTSSTLNTQIEVTPGRDSRPFLKVEHTISGWSLKKKRLLRLVEKMSEQLKDLNPKTGLINPAEFSQTKKVQSFSLSWSLLVYSEGVDRLLHLLDLNQTSTLEAQQFLIQLMGRPQYVAYCQDQDLDPGVSLGPLEYSHSQDPDPGILESSRGQQVYLGCVTDFMRTIFSLRSTLSRKSALFSTKSLNQSQIHEKIRLLNRVVDRLMRKTDLSNFIKLVGPDHSFFQARVSGFRTHDENGDSDYFSNTLGFVDQKQLAGPLSDIATQSTISTNEIEARYLSNGY